MEDMRGSIFLEGESSKNILFGYCSYSNVRGDVADQLNSPFRGVGITSQIRHMGNT